MLEVSNVRVYDLKECVTSCRNAMRLQPAEYTEEEFQKGLERAKKLVCFGGGSGHTNFRTGIRVSFDLKYTQYITKQFQRYHWFDYVNSTSLMHRITKMDFDKCSTIYVSQETVDRMNRLTAEYNAIEEKGITEMTFELRNGTVINAKTKAECEYYQFMRIINECPMGTELYVRVSTNYEQLASIVRQRKNHKLKEDWGAFIEFVKTLPYAEDLIPELNPKKDGER